MTTDQGRARVVRQLQRETARSRHPVRALACRPENLEAVRELVEEAGVDLPVVIDPEAFGFFQSLRGGELEERYPEQAREWAREQEQRCAQTSEPPGSRRQDTLTNAEVQIIVHPSETPQKLTVETGPAGITVHLGGG